MIVYVCAPNTRSVLTSYLTSWGRELERRIRLVSYDDLRHAGRLPRATYVFADLERMTARQRERAAVAWRILDSESPDCRLLNHPLNTRRRYSLLRELNKRGINDFDVYRAEEDRRPSRYPVFVRRENSHSKPLSGLLHTAAELESAEREIGQRFARDDTLITEFLNTPDEQGRFWKYSSFIVGDRIVPGHVFVEKHWCVKKPAVVDDEIAMAEYEFVNNSPHEELLREVARIAGVSYGRIDFGLFEGRPQIYEINTHPQIMGADDGHFERRSRARQVSAKLIESAFREIDTDSVGAVTVNRGNRRRKSLRDRYFELRARVMLSF